MLANVDSVTPSDVQALAQGFAQSSQTTVALVGSGDFESVRF